MGVNPRDIHETAERVLSDKRWGLNVTASGGVIIGVVFFQLLGLTLLLFKAMKIDMKLTEPHFIILGLVSFAICHVFVFRKDAYLEYVERYEKWTRREALRYGLASWTYVVCTILLFLLSL